MASTLGTHNPLRYRGYVYDNETGLYYLQSRYYNPQVGRFLNADTFVSTGQGLLGNNMFAYSLNNPVMYFDVSGEIPTGILGLGDFYFIHKKVQKEVKEQTGWETEVYVTHPDRNGRLDLYDSATNSYYEVKSSGAAYNIYGEIRESTGDQLERYDDSTIAFRKSTCQ